MNGYGKWKKLLNWIICNEYQSKGDETPTMAGQKVQDSKCFKRTFIMLGMKTSKSKFNWNPTYFRIWMCSYHTFIQDLKKSFFYENSTSGFAEISWVTFSGLYWASSQSAKINLIIMGSGSVRISQADPIVSIGRRHIRRHQQHVRHVLRLVISVMVVLRWHEMTADGTDPSVRGKL